MSTPLPKLSYVLLSHNREKYIRGAIESAFAQDYEGELEYIFSDDCSTDRTFEIIKECVAAYKGNRRVVVTQTPQNLHLAGNTNHAVQFVESDWIVRADDDDYSSVDRCSIIGKAIAEHPDCSYVYTLFEHFTDADDERVREQMTKKSSGVSRIERIDILHGMHDFWEEFSGKQTLHQVWSARHFKEYGNLPLDGYWVDDVISNLRCCTFGYGIKVHALTSYIRRGVTNMSTGGTYHASSYSEIIQLERFNDKYYNVTQAPFMEMQQSIRSYIDKNCIEGTEQFFATLERDIENRKLLCSFWRKSTVNRLLVSYKVGYRGLFALLRCLPMPVYARLLALYRKLFGKTKNG